MDTGRPIVRAVLARTIPNDELFGGYEREGHASSESRAVIPVHSSSSTDQPSLASHIRVAAIANRVGACFSQRLGLGDVERSR